MMQQPRKWKSLGWEGSLLLVGVLAGGAFIAVNSCDGSQTGGPGPGGLGKVTGTGGGAGTTAFAGDEVVAAAAQSIVNGRKTFRFDTFGDEAFWGDTLKLHQAIAGEANGGVGPGRQPEDGAGGRPQGRRRGGARRRRGRASRRGTVDLDDPATTLALLKLNAVVGVTGLLRRTTASSQSMGIQCALCHSTVDDSFAPGIGKRLDGWAEPRSQRRRDHLAGARSVGVHATCCRSTRRRCGRCWPRWGPGKFDAELVAGRQGLPPRRQDGRHAAAAGVRPGRRRTCTPGRAGARSRTGTPSSRTSRCTGKGTFYDPRLNDAGQVPGRGARTGFGARRRNDPDLDHAQAGRSARLPARRCRRRRRRRAASTRPPPSAARRCSTGKARCASCHVPPIVQRAGLEPCTRPRRSASTTSRPSARPTSATARRRSAACTRTRRAASIHDGRFATLRDVVDHYDALFKLGLHDRREGRSGRVPEVAVTVARLTAVAAAVSP